ncbi:MAG TPA: mannose-1-phosphate guanylyltransferase [Bacteroidetes bacterium]|nr:mannose-1-phosphate guanylyltransferase [Bacteroidota bacterium]
MNKHHYCLIMAGGVGSRFWPLSRVNKPKQFLDILGVGKSLLQMTYARFINICPRENIFIVTNEEYTDIVLEQLPEINPERVISEPLRKNTAPCVIYSSYKIHKIDPEAVIVVSPSDHFIQDEKKFLTLVKEGLTFAAGNDALVTLGIEPLRPETGYGYIQIKKGGMKYTHNKNIKKVKTFTEKPDLKMAELFLKSGDFYWNSGIFIWSVRTILNAFEKHMPDLYHLFSEGEEVYNTDREKEFIFKTYANCTEISIDYAIMEKAENVYVLCSDFGWSDLGTWNSLYEHSQRDDHGNVVTGGKILLYDTHNSIIRTDNNRLVVINGLDEFIVVQSGEILLICPKQEEQRIKQFVNDVQIRTKDQYI